MGKTNYRGYALATVAAGGVLLVVGAVIGLVPFNDGTCGSAFFGIEHTSDNLIDQAICTSEHAGLAPTAIVMLVVGALAMIIGGVLAAAARPTVRVVAPKATSPSGSGLTDELDKLASLHESGHLTDGEYSAAKTKELGS